MSLSKSFIIVLSLIMCFCVLSKQIHASYDTDLEIASHLNVAEIEAYNSHDCNEPTTLLLPAALPAIVSSIEIILFDEIYSQPHPSLLLRPPRNLV
jgi:hypothetical protein